jgi:hypothetical protein
MDSSPERPVRNYTGSFGAAAGWAAQIAARNFTESLCPPTQSPL